MVMSSQLHASAALTLVKSPSVGYAVDRSLSETQSPLEAKMLPVVQCAACQYASLCPSADSHCPDAGIKLAPNPRPSPPAVFVSKSSGL
jgi:hypothetical protein